MSAAGVPGQGLQFDRAASRRLDAELVVGEANGWEPPVPLLHGERLAFPAEKLPPEVRDFVEAEAEATQTPTDLAGMLALAMLATTAQGKIKVEVRPGWQEPVNIYALIIQPSASRKSTVHRDASAPVVEYEASTAARLGPEIASQWTRHKIREDQLDRLRKQAARAKSADQDALILEAEQLARELAAEPPPTTPRLLADDATPEAVGSLLAAQGGRLTLSSAEGGELFQIMQGRYSNGSPNLGVFLNAHAGDPIRVDRQGRASLYVSEPALTMALTAQPDVLDGLQAVPQLKGRGLLARILYAVPLGLVGHRRADAAPVPAPVQVAYHALLQRLLAREGEAQVCRFDAAGRAHMVAFEKYLEPMLAPTGSLAHMTDWGGKAAGAAARIAGLLAWADQGGPCEIPGEAVLRAVALVDDYLLPHARTAHGLMGNLGMSPLRG